MVDNQKYPWKRLWVPGMGPAVDEALTHPDYFTSVAGAEPLERWQQTPCLILLGEPGMGKSAEWTHQQLSGPPRMSVSLNLGEYGSWQEIEAKLTGHPRIRRWLRQREEELWLWLDSFDEALLHEAKLAHAIGRLLEQWPSARLHLRILSRTATWPVSFTEHLEAYFGQSPEQPEQVLVLQLAPLTKYQVTQAAEIKEIDAAALIAAVERAEAVPLATRPVALALLFKLWEFGRFGPAIGKGINLLESGCRLLCEEGWNPQQSHFRLPDVDQRLRVAAQLAVVMVCSRRRVITADELNEDEMRLPLRDVTGILTLFPDKPHLLLSKELVMEVVQDTGLFVPSTKDGLVTEVRWAHPVFADFLAAWALHKTEVAPAQLRKLFQSAVPEAGVVPALRDAAVWLASLSPEFAAILVQLDPLTAMRADVLAATDAQRASLVAQLLAIATERHLYLQRAEPYMSRLAHPHLASQLAPVLADFSAPPEARALAHKMAVSCVVHALAPLLVQQALDTTLATAIRVEALQTLQFMGNAADNQQLRPLRTAIPADDSDDEFRGTLLHILWPGALAADELLPLLTPQNKTSLTGAYNSFLDPIYTGGLQDGLAVSHLPALLRWLVRRPRQDYGTDLQMAEFVRNIVISRAWQHTDDEAVLPWLAFALRRLLTRGEVPNIPHDPALRNRVLNCWVQRRQLPRPTALIQPYQVEPKRYGQQGIPRQALVDVADFELILALLCTTTHVATVASLFRTALLLFEDGRHWRKDRFQLTFSILYELGQRWHLDTAFAWLSEVDSYAGTSYRETREMRQQQRLQAKLRRRMNSRTYRLLIRLSHPARPNPVASWLIARKLLIRSSSGHCERITTEIGKGLSWLRSSTRLRQRLGELAWRAVEAAPPQIAFGQAINTFYEDDSIPLTALLFCQDVQPERVASFTVEQWQPWLRALLFGHVSAARRTELFGVALRYHRRAVLRYLAAQSDYWQQLQASAYGLARLGELLTEVPDEALWRWALQGVMAGRWPRLFAQETLGKLLALRFRSAELFRDFLFAQSPAAPFWHISTFATFHESLFNVAVVKQLPTVAWWATWQHLLSFSPELGVSLIERQSGRLSWITPLPPDLSDEHVVSLLWWVIGEVGVSETKTPNGRRPVGADRLRIFRNMLSKLLAGRATAEAYEALAALAHEYEYPSWLTYHLEEARETYSRRKWEPLAPAQLFRFLRQATD